MSRAERRLLTRLVAVHATTAVQAHPLPSLASAPTGWKQRLEAAGLLHAATGGQYYVGLGAYIAYRCRRRWRLSVLVLTLAVMVAGVVLIVLKS